MAEDSRAILARLKERIESRKFGHDVNPPDLTRHINAMIDQTISDTRELYQKHNGDLDGIRHEVLDRLKRVGSYPQVMSAVRTYEARHKIHQDEHKELKKIENAQGRRSVVWRAASTFAAAGVIFFFYWLAGYWGVNLPLSRFPM